MEWNRIRTTPAESAYFIEANNMVDMVMGVENVVSLGDAFAKGLFSQVGPSIDENFDLVGLEKDGRAGALVPWVGGGADFAITSDDRYSDRGAGAKKCQSSGQGA